MLRKLAIRNAKRSIKDYLIYLITVIMSFSLIIAFNLIVYSKDVRELSSMMVNFRLAVIEVSVLVVFVIGWLINYTMKFMLSKRSKEFGTYIIVPDDAVSDMKILDKFIMINTKEQTTEKLYNDICKYVKSTMKNDKEKSEFYPNNLDIKGEVISENRLVLTIFSFILLYIAFIFTAIVATILAIQTLSDSTKYKYHYSILSKLGVEQSQIYKTIRKQLLILFLFPVIYPIIIDISVTTSLNGLLNPVLSSEYSYLYAILYSLSLFLFIYLIYFIATYFGYKKNIEE